MSKSGTVIRIHSNFYYVDFMNLSWECMLRNKLKKEGLEPKVGDKVIIDELNDENNTAVITKILPRHNELNKPNIANIDQVIIVMSTYEPDFNPLLLDKFIILTESNNIEPVICINKSDKLDDELKRNIENLYIETGYQIVYTSAKENNGLDSLKETLSNKVSVLTGASGVGKSSLLNALDPELNLVTAEVSKNLGTGRHTTRHVSLQKVDFNGKNAFIADTPGFSFIEFSELEPVDLAWQFKEFSKYIPDCAMSDCLHWTEPGCRVKEFIDNDNNRYQNYIYLLKELKEQEKEKSNRSTKKESQVKVSKRADGKNIRVVKLGTQARENSRRTVKQDLAELGKISSLEDLDEEY